jgi:tRNA G18 (ribose-2'-O)-methylase SpoU
MYNDLMPATTFEVRLCTSCGLRYPLTEGHVFGTRCPICLGDTRLLLSRELVLEPKQDRAALDLTTDPSPSTRGEYAVLLDNIRSAWNVGSILRSADGFAFSHAYLCGITPTPDNEAVAKTSLGAEDSVSWSYHKDAVKLVNGLIREGWRIWALEEDEGSQSIQTAVHEHARQPVVLILGNEVTGVDPDLLDLCDEIFYIPMRGEKKSFNVAMAFSIAAYQIRK